MASKTITHRGIIKSINPEITEVEIVSESACASCHAASLCGVSESGTKTVEIRTSPYEEHSIGEEVTVELRASLGHKAVWLGYGIPLFILVAGILVPSAAGAAELTCGVCGIAAVALYYSLLALFKDRIAKEYEFKLSKHN